MYKVQLMCGNVNCVYVCVCVCVRDQELNKSPDKPGDQGTGKLLDEETKYTF